MMRFVPFVFIAAILWASYGALLGYLGGRTFENHPIYALLLALGIAAAISAAVEGYRRVRK
jgi:membrane protein DedA with SNARE-associated domain